MTLWRARVRQSSKLASGKSRKQFHLCRLGRAKKRNSVFGEVAFVVKSTRIAEIVRPIELGGEADSLAVAKFANGEGRVCLAVEARTNARVRGQNSAFDVDLLGGQV